MKDDKSDTGPFASAPDETLLLSGSAFLKAIAHDLRNATGASVSIVGSLRVAEADKIFVLGSSVENGSELYVAQYDASNTPCFDAIEGREIVIRDGDFARVFPTAPCVRLLQTKSYMGFPLFDERGDVVGVFALAWQDPFTDKTPQDIIEIVSPVLPRIASEVGNASLNGAIETLAEPHQIIPPSQDDTFAAIAVQAQKLVQIDVALVAKASDPSGTAFEVLAAATAGALVPDSTGKNLALADGQFDADICILPGNTETPLPSIGHTTQGAASFVAMRIRSDDGKPIGLLAFFHSRRMSKRLINSGILNILYLKSRQELFRLAAETEREALRDSLNIRNKFESLGLLAGTVAHDFNNQLAGILGNIELAELELAADSSARETLSLAKDQLWVASDTVKDLMAFAGGQSPREHEVIDLNGIVRNVVKSLNPESIDGVTIDVDLAKELPAIKSLASNLLQILTNLVLNSLESLNGQAGRLRFSTRVVSPSLGELRRSLSADYEAHNGPLILLEVEDNGPGMDQATAAKIFDPFFSTKGVSRGLGLSGVLGMARKLNIAITLDTTTGRGTRFKLYFQPHPETQTGKANSEVVSDPADSATSVLVIEDAEDIRAILARQLKHLGFQSVAFGSGEDALNALDQIETPCIAIVDMLLPGQDGVRTATALREHHANLPIILASGHFGLEQLESEELPLGTVLLQKPYSISELTDCFSRLDIDARR